MRLVQLLTTLVIMVGCVTTGSKPTIDDKIQRYAEEFYKDFPYATEVVIKAERTIASFLHGRCLPDVPVAIVAPWSIKGFTDGQIQYLVYHELGHCALDLAHNNDTVIMGGSPFPDKFTVKAVIELREHHRKTCDGETTSVRKSAFGPNAPRHLSCFIRDSIEDED